MDRAEFKQFGKFSSLDYMPIEGFVPDFNDKEYKVMVKERMKDRLNFVMGLDKIDQLPEEALNAIQKVIDEA
jgi:phosphoenolpyruvate carboxykinase (ATP)